MCGLVALVGTDRALEPVHAMAATLDHRGPDGRGAWCSPDGTVALGHRRLAVIDRSAAGDQPMVSPDGRYVLVFNGEIYNYVELRAELGDWSFRGGSDTEVLLAAWATWGEPGLHRLLGMFAFAVWDTVDGSLTLGRDRFGVKPLFVSERPGGALAVASEIKAFRPLAGAPAPDPVTWATWLATGQADGLGRTFCDGIRPVPAGHLLRWQGGRTEETEWYDLASAVVGSGDAGATDAPDARADAEVLDEYEALARDAVRLRFRSDVPVGIALSSGLDSSTLLALVDTVGPDERAVHAFTFTTGDPDYDEVPWVRSLVAGSGHPLHECRLSASEVPRLAEEVARSADEPYGGLPTLAYARLFETARQAGVTVVLDGQGMDEQWAGYDYYRTLTDPAADAEGGRPVVQGTSSAATRPEALGPALAAALPRAAVDAPVPAVGLDALTRAQIRDLTTMKLPRALRFNDRVSMRSSAELREPFLDHRLVELALRQPAHRKVDATTGKLLLRRLARERLDARDVAAPKRPVQTPQREWLRGPLREWTRELVADGLDWQPGWLDAEAVRTELDGFLDGRGDNAFFVWQWISLGLAARTT